MEHNFPCPIRSDKDLNFYEDYLKSCDTEQGDKSCQMTVENSPSRGVNTCTRLSDEAFLPAYLKTMTGKLVRVESLIGGCLESRVGILLEVGADYIVLKLYRGCSTMICEASSIKYITVIHDNDMNKSGLF